MGADVRDSTAAAGKCAPRGRLHSSAQLAMVEACPGRSAVHGLDSQGRTGSARRRIHDQRHSAGVCAGEFTRSVARGNGEIYSSRIRSGVPDALRNPRPPSRRSDEHRIDFFEAGAEATGIDAATDQQPLRHSAGRRRFPSGSSRYSAE